MTRGFAEGSSDKGEVRGAALIRRGWYENAKATLDKVIGTRRHVSSIRSWCDYVCKVDLNYRRL